MRLTVIALIMLPMSALAQDASTDAPQQSCPVGMTWDADGQSCIVAADGSSPLQELPGHVGCGKSAARQVTS